MDENKFKVINLIVAARDKIEAAAKHNEVSDKDKHSAKEACAVLDGLITFINAQSIEVPADVEEWIVEYNDVVQDLLKIYVSE